VSARPADTLVEVPNLTLSTLDEARVALARRGLKLGRVDARNAPQARPGLVLEQSVQPAGRVATGTPVNVVVAAAPAAGGVAQQDGKAGKAGKPATQPAGTLAQDSWVAQAGEPVRVTVDALCGKRVLLAYQRCVERECAKAVHADDPLCRTQPPAATGGN
jgi:beta-lactam-binding protein with PASTA domain